MFKTTPPPAPPRFAPAIHPQAASKPVPPKPATAPAAAPVDPPEEEPAAHDYSSTQVDLPPEICAAMLAFGAAVPKDKLDAQGLEGEPHITIKYGNSSADPAPIAEALKGKPAVTVKFGKLGIFKGADGGPDVLKIEVISPGLRKLNTVIGKAADHPGNSFPSYIPHSTIGYFKPGEADEYDGQSLPGVTGETITLASVTFSGKDGKLTSIPLEGNTSAVVEHLRRDLANIAVSYFSAKAHHWEASGPQFLSLHELWDGIAAGVWELLDDAAERLRALDAPVGLVAMADYQEAATITAAAAGLSMAPMIEAELKNAQAVIEGMRETSKAAEEAGDPGTVDLVGKEIRVFEKAAWFLRQHLIGPQ